MGFPTWTLLGMGLTFVGALIMVILAYIAQSPGFAARIGLGGTRIAFQVKTFTGYALAFMLLFLGFFLAGVPIDPAIIAIAAPTETPAALVELPETSGLSGLDAYPAPGEGTGVPDVEAFSTPDPNAALTPASGAFGGPPPGLEGLEGAGDVVETAVAIDNATPAGPETSPTATPTTAFTATPVTFTPTPTSSSTPTPTPTPTLTPTPTVTPTPIVGDTAVMNLAGGVLWLQRSPGGQNMLVLQDREVVILHDGRANRGGVIWREVATGNGTIGWVEERFLQLNEN